VGNEVYNRNLPQREPQLLQFLEHVLGDSEGHIPEELKARPQWVAWRFAERNGERTKIPVNPHWTQRLAKTDDPATWSSFEQALNVCL
jgi:primase-polymerase (primpol)-like protein